MTAEIVMMPLKDITPYEKNPRRNDDSVDAVAASIKEFGFRQPVVVDGNNTIIVGHTRWKAAKKLKLKAIPVMVADDLTEAQVKAYRIADNSTGEIAAWDYDLLADELAVLDFDMSEYGLDIVMGEEGEDSSGPGEVIEDEPPEPDLGHEATVKRGEIWKLGNHFLMCGDSTSQEDLRKLMAQGGGRLSNMTFTDPPYGVAIGTKNRMLQEVNGGEQITEDILNDTLDMESVKELLTDAMTNLRDSSEDDASYYVTAPQGGDLMRMMEALRDAGLPVRHLLVWVKNTATFSMRRLDYDYQHEPIMYTWGKSHKYYGKGEIKTSIWPFDKPHKSDLHPTMKPVGLVAEAILNSSKKGDIITDIFGGSGTTLIACEQTDREARMMELDPHYCDVIIKRWEEFTGKTAERVSA